MITVFGFLGESDDAPSLCVEVKFDGGPNGGNVSYTTCEGFSTNKLLAPNQVTKALCVQDQSWTFGDFFMGVILIGPCSTEPPPPNTDNVFMVERQLDGFSTYAGIPNNNTFAVNDIVNIDGDIECYEIIGTATVFDPTIYPLVISNCLGGGPPAGP
jgi:hypothetical protein